MSKQQLLSPLQIACGIVSGPGFNEYVPETDSLHSPIQALEEVLAEALSDSPCFISFTGGRDSSAMLAVAVRVAHERDLPAPIPVTMVFPHVRTSDEAAWQELIIDHLRLDRSAWERIVVRDGELDLIGDSATGLLTRHGLLYPPNILLGMPIIDRIGSSTVVTGIEGDGLLGGWRHAYFSDIAHRNRPLRLGELASEAYQFMPSPVRRAVVRRRALEMPWLTPRGYQQFAEAWTNEKVGAPRRWDRWVAWWAQRRYLELLVDGFARVASDYGTRPVHPLLDARFLHALAKHGGAFGFGDRRQLMHAIFGADLPPQLLNRTTKAATFSELVWSSETKKFAASWNGKGVDTEIVDISALKEIWNGRSPATVPDELTSLLLQSVWLNQNTAT